MSVFGPTDIPPIDQSQLPASVRNGTPDTKKAYETALGFEQILVGELSKELAATASTSSDGSDSSTDGSSGLLAGDASTNAYADLLPDALTSSIMSAGATGIAQQIAAALNPTTSTASASTAAASTAATGTGSTSGTTYSSGSAAATGGVAATAPAATGGAATAPTQGQVSATTTGSSSSSGGESESSEGAGGVEKGED
jgi:Rod binding domain-containing protein